MVSTMKRIPHAAWLEGTVEARMCQVFDTFSEELLLQNLSGFIVWFVGSSDSSSFIAMVSRCPTKQFCQHPRIAFFSAHSSPVCSSLAQDLSPGSTKSAYFELEDELAA